MDTKSLKKFSTELAIGSFAIGTVIFLLCVLIPKTAELFIAGFFYLLLAGIINALMILYLVVAFFRHPIERQEIAIRILLLLCNIPIALLYFFILVEFIFEI